MELCGLHPQSHGQQTRHSHQGTSYVEQDLQAAKDAKS